MFSQVILKKIIYAPFRHNSLVLCTTDIKQDIFKLRAVYAIIRLCSETNSLDGSD